MAGVADLLIKMSMDSRGVSTGAQQAESKLTQMASKAQNAMRLLAFGGIATVGKELFNAGIEAEAMGRRFDTVFGAAGAGITPQVDDLARSMGIASIRAQGMAADIGRILTPMGLSQTAAADASVEVLHLADVWDQFTGGTKGAAAITDSLTRAVLGQTRGLIELGIKISETDVKTRLAALGQGELTGAALKAAEAQARIALITEASGDALAAYAAGEGDAEKAADDMAAALDTMKYKVGQAVAGLAPLISGLASLATVTGKVDGLLPGIAAGLGALALGVPGLGALVIGIVAAGAASGSAALDFDALLHEGKALDLGFRQAADAIALFEERLAAAKATGATVMGWGAPTIPVSLALGGEHGGIAGEVERLSLSVQMAAAQAAEDAAESARIREAEDAFGASLAAGFSDALRDNQGDITKAIEDLIAAAENQAKVSAQMREMALLGLGAFAEGLTGSPEEIAAALDVMVGEAGSLSNMLAIAEALGDNTSAAFIRGMIHDASRLQAMADWFAQLSDAAVRGWGHPVLPSPAMSGGGSLPPLTPMASGGIVPGPMGAPFPILAHGGETVIPAGRGGGTPTVNISVGGSIVTDRELLSYIRRGLREYAQAGGSLQL